MFAAKFMATKHVKPSLKAVTTNADFFILVAQWH